MYSSPSFLSSLQRYSASTAVICVPEVVELGAATFTANEPATVWLPSLALTSTAKLPRNPAANCMVIWFPVKRKETAGVAVAFHSRLGSVCTAAGNLCTSAAAVMVSGNVPDQRRSSPLG